jgi:hypothetical protein
MNERTIAEYLGGYQKLSAAAKAKALLLATDFTWYAPRCLKIKTKVGEVIPFELNRVQLYIHDLLEKQRRTTGRVRALILKGRQQGVSTYIEGRFYWKTSTNRGKRAYILTHMQEATDNLFSMTRRFHDNCPDPIKPSTKNESAKALTFDTLDSEFSVATAGSKDTGRSGTGQYFHGSEVAFWASAADHMAGIGQTIPNEDGTEICLESTGNGMGNLFHSMWVDAVRGESDYIPIFVPWFWQPEYRLLPPAGWTPDPEGIEYCELYGIGLEQAYWRDRKIRNDFRGETTLFDQEYPATADLAFRRQALATLLKISVVERAMKTKNIEAIGPKIMGIDPAESEEDLGDDTVFCLRQGRVVHEFRRFHGKHPMEVVGLAAKAIEEWQPDYINVDAGGLGSGIADRLIELGHPAARVMFGQRAIELDLYGLRRDEMWGEMAEWFKDPVQLPYDMAALTDLTSPAKDEDGSLRFKLETKKHMKARGVKSPDAGDALALTFAQPVAKTTNMRKRVNRTNDVTNWRAL